MGRPDEAVAFFAEYVSRYKRSAHECITEIMYLSFVSNGFKCPATYNPADFIIGTLATTGHTNESHKLAHRICDAYAARQIPETRKLQSISEESLDDVRMHSVSPKDRKNNFFFQNLCSFMTIKVISADRSGFSLSSG